MIIFSRDDLNAVLAGRKIQTRRLWPTGPRANPGTVHTIQTGRLSTPAGTIIVNSVEREQIGDISEDDARAEGYNTKKGYLYHFMMRNGEMPLKTLVWVVKFELLSKNVDSV